ncbi:hypothetical protein [Fulvimonas yonginensis]|uniref:Glycosyltransferase RgtA/B/C/D-like domain-containing protein n=1 Tax=Fulvimonas yonginensis TaxID=1495200 RepID=A0ABU8JA99_9GAMM
MKPAGKENDSLLWLGIALLGASTLLMWLPALHTPFWGDDYVYLAAAHATNMAAAPWWSDFLPANPPRFWRPLSQEGYWRLIDLLLGDDAYAAHVASLGLHLLACGGVATLAFAIARACRWPRPRLTAVLAGVLYAGLAMHVLPVFWAAAANNSFLTLFTTLCLAAGIWSAESEGMRRALWLTSIPLSLSLALLSKESAVLTVPLMVIVRLFTGQRRVRKGDVLTLVACAAITAVWLVLRAHFTTRTDPPYDLVLGGNLVRNAAAFVAWMSDVPREALRMAATGMLPRALAWIAATALPMLAAAALALRHGRLRLRPEQWLFVALFAVVAYGPYFLLGWNSYAYYAAVGAILPAVTLARCCIGSPRLWLILPLVAVSSWVAVEGTRRLDHPGLIGRARWAEAMLHDLEQRNVGYPLWVAVKDPHRFYAVGEAGLAWRLKLPPASIHVAERCPATVRRCLQIAEDGSWHLEQTTGIAR